MRVPGLVLRELREPAQHAAGDGRAAAAEGDLRRQGPPGAVLRQGHYPSQVTQQGRDTTPLR